MKVIRRFLKHLNDRDFTIGVLGQVTMRIKRGDKVRINEVLYDREYKKILESYSVQKELGVQPQYAKEFVVRLNGEYVTKGEILAERLTNAGLVVKKIYATVDGLLSFERLNSGYIDILSEYEEETIKSNLNGTVSDFDHQRSITITSKALGIDLVTSWKSEVCDGEFVVIKNADSVYTVKDLDESYSEKIVYAGRFVYPELVAQILKRGAKAVVVWSMNYRDYELVKSDVAILGGFGQIPYDYTISHTINSLNGSQIMIEGDSIVIADRGQILMTQTKDIIASELKVNQQVKILDSENYGLIGKIVDTTNDDGYFTIVINNGDRLLLPEQLLTPIF